MLLLLNSGRPLTRVAAEARIHPDPHLAARLLPWYRDYHRGPQQPPTVKHEFPDDVVPSDTLCARYELLIRTALLGGPSEVRDVLTEDVEIWSPTACFSSRAQVEAALHDQVPPVAVVEFRVDTVLRNGCSVAAQWHLEATQTDALLVDDDLLVERSERTVNLVGVTAAELRNERIARLSTYFDDAALIEQLILGESPTVTHPDPPPTSDGPGSREH